MSDAPRWHLASGLPWRVARLGVVVAVPDGTVVAGDLAAQILVLLPATVAELGEALPGVSAVDVGAALDHLASMGLVVPG